MSNQGYYQGGPQYPPQSYGGGYPPQGPPPQGYYQGPPPMGYQQAPPQQVIVREKKDRGCLVLPPSAAASSVKKDVNVAPTAANVSLSVAKMAT
ncbi:uncharacterized protein Z518_06270 [Rhinocladiella mackenziei CBS 650.93]|uniref:Cysteine-rich transmembrane CYSTM domain-containing protein n=1 Tax=Rhinocladiella mackenziei CBS 650.93 TaxID=1442369 RepID=A0A0D2H4R1_9EURO|nr:uncharacterized protein Z518_06270 [Rhinocladiella mackenziei CBS 650.93]KIX05398.1 hypothetical protein Z518_06270 [Rhinocladiella mackenziei CBS 650.93]